MRYEPTRQDIEWRDARISDLEAKLSAALRDQQMYRSALLDFLAYFKSGNEVPVERAVIRADSMAVIMGNQAIDSAMEKQT